MPTQQHEIEVKLSLSPQAFEQLRAREWPEENGPAPVRATRSIYFDTRDHRLRRAGIALRLRATPEGWEQTVKLGLGPAQGLANRLEHEVMLEQPVPDLRRFADAELRRTLRQTVGRAKLRAQFETDVARETHAWHSDDGSVIELVLDQGEVRAKERRATLRECELELKAGPAHALLNAAATLLTDVPFTLGTMSKAECGYRLLTGESVAATPPPPATPLPKGMPGCLDVLRARGEAITAEILRRWQQTLTGDDPEGPHQLRVNLRRLRSLLRAFRPLTKDDTLKRMEREARDVGRVVGRLRDADVALSDIVAPVQADSANGTSAALDVLQHHLAAQREALRAEVRASLQDAAWSWFKLHCALFGLLIERQPLKKKAAARPAISFAPKAIGKRWNAVREWGDALDHLSDEERHEMRKVLKTLRYTIEIFADLYPKQATKPYLKRLKALQDRFGYLNDVTLAHELAKDPTLATAQAELRDAARSVLAWHEAQTGASRDEMIARWRELEGEAKFWAA